MSGSLLESVSTGVPLTTTVGEPVAEVADFGQRCVQDCQPAGGFDGNGRGSTSRGGFSAGGVGYGHAQRFGRGGSGGDRIWRRLEDQCLQVGLHLRCGPGDGVFGRMPGNHGEPAAAERAGGRAGFGDDDGLLLTDE